MPVLTYSSGDLLADRRYDYARGFATDGDHAAAVDLFVQTLERTPGWLPARIGLADSLVALGRTDEAADILETAIPDDVDGLFGARLKLAALGRLPVPATPPVAYVRGLFDDYADRFDKALVDGLAYRVPWLLAERLAVAGRLTGRASGFARALDLGCGTGLMADALSGRAGHLTGVDLSPEMVAHAEAKGMYDALAVDDVVSYVRSNTGPWDLVTAADVFVYLGALEAVFAAVSGKLAPGGVFAFSCERGEADYVLRESLRYAHGEDYLRRLAAQNGLRVLTVDREILRMDRGKPVDGLLVILLQPPV